MSSVALFKTSDCSYPKCFRPGEKYPEYVFGELSDTDNNVYEAVRECFHLMRLDAENYNTVNWNPLKDYVKPGNIVLIKPNLVMDVNHNKEGTDCLYTNPSVVAPVIDYVLIALGGKGKIVVGDAPMQECNFDNLVESSGYGRLVEYYRAKGIDIELVDFRELTSVVSHGVYVSSLKESVKGKVVNLGRESEFYGCDDKQVSRMRITNYDPRILPTHHGGKTQEYYVSQYVLDADVIINMPKPKTHRKAGMTGALKNFVGANVRKEYLPHHTQGSVAEGGDEYLKKNYFRGIQSKLLDERNVLWAEKKYKRSRWMQYFIRLIGIMLKMTDNKYDEGSWYGNHTISRTICDLNKIVFFADKEGNMKSVKQRKMFIVGDMIISGEKEGPVTPSPKDVGIIVMGDNPLLFDETVATIMGFDIKRIPTFITVKQYDGKYKFLDSEQVCQVISNDARYDDLNTDFFTYSQSLQYEPTAGWKGHIEISK